MALAETLSLQPHRNPTPTTNFFVHRHRSPVNLSIIFSSSRLVLATLIFTSFYLNHMIVYGWIVRRGFGVGRSFSISTMRQLQSTPPLTTTPPGGHHRSFSRLQRRIRKISRPQWFQKQSRIFSSSLDSSGNSGESGQDLYSLKLIIPEADDMDDLGALLAVMSNPPDAIVLDGDLGAGKTSLSRGFILCKLGLDGNNNDGESSSSAMRVTSPTYLLSNTYRYQDQADGDHELKEIRHMDLYRLSGEKEKEFLPLDLEHVYRHCISLMEWPSRIYTSFPNLMPPPDHRLDVDIVIQEEDERLVTLSCPLESSWKLRLSQLVDQELLEDWITEESI